MDRGEQQLQLIRAVYRVESARQHGSALDQLRTRCNDLLDLTDTTVAGDARLQHMLATIRTEVRG